MAAKHAVRPLILAQACTRFQTISKVSSARSLSSLSSLCEGQQLPSTTEPASPPPIANTVQSKAAADFGHLRHQTPESLLFGSRRRRAAIQRTSNIPFDQLPYQCFQEARKILAEDREEKVKQIEETRKRIASVLAADAASCGGQARKETRLRSLRARLLDLKIQADINDPNVKKKFEDGQGDMNKPIYRFLADRKWRSYKRKVLMQRITQMNVTPDVLPKIDPVAEVRLAFGRKAVQPGDKVNSSWTEQCPTLQIQPFDSGDRLVTVVVVDSDVPDLDNDRFQYRCQGIFTNINISPTKTKVHLGRLSPEQQVVMAWQPPTAQKGAPYHRISIWVLQHPEGLTMDAAAMREQFARRDGFILRRFMSNARLAWGNKPLLPVGVAMFRTEWDEAMEGVMKRVGIPGWDVEFKRTKVEPLPYRKKDGERYR